MRYLLQSRFASAPGFLQTREAMTIETQLGKKLARGINGDKGFWKKVFSKDLLGLWLQGNGLLTNC